MVKKSMYRAFEPVVDDHVASDDGMPELVMYDYEILIDGAIIKGHMYNKGDIVTITEAQANKLQSREVCMSRV